MTLPQIPGSYPLALQSAADLSAAADWLELATQEADRERDEWDARREARSRAWFAKRDIENQHKEQ